jgi:hypothetical protein
LTTSHEEHCYTSKKLFTMLISRIKIILEKKTFVQSFVNNSFFSLLLHMFSLCVKF